MKIAIPVESKSLDIEVCQSFGRAPFFAVYDSDKSETAFLVNSAADGQGGAGVKAAQIVADSGASAVILPRCGENAAEVLTAADIKLYKSIAGSVKNNIEALLSGSLGILQDIHAGFHNHG